MIISAPTTMRLRVIIPAILLCFGASLMLFGQDDTAPVEIVWASRPYVVEEAAAPVVRVQSNLVEVATVVLDKHDKPVPNLNKSDFELFDDGKQQTITSFSLQEARAQSGAAETGVPKDSGAAFDAGVQPRSIALFFDDVNGSFRNPNLNFARDASIKFVKRGIEPGEKIGIFTASGTLQLGFTDNSEQLLATLAKLRMFSRMPDQGINPCPPLSQYQAWVIVHLGGMTQELQDAIRAAQRCCWGAAESCARTEAESVTSIAEDYSLGTLKAIPYVLRALAQRPGSRVLLLTSSGFLTHSFASERERVIGEAVRAGVVINSLDTRGVVFDDRYGTHFNLLLPLSELALGTGGKLIHNNNDLETGFRTLSAPPSISYVLGFTPEKMEADGRRHSLKVKLAQQGKFTINARPAYYDPSPEISPAEKRFQKLQKAVQTEDIRSEIPSQFNAEAATQSNGQSSLGIRVHVDVHKLPFERMMWGSNDQRQVERLVFITVLFGADNKFLTGVEGVMDLKLKDATLKELEEKGIDARLSLQAPRGSYRIRQVVQESVGGKISSFSQAIQVN